MGPLGDYEIVPSGSGFNVVHRPSETLVFQDREFPSKEVAFQAFREYAQERGLNLRFATTPQDAGDHTKPIPLTIRLVLTVSPEFDQLLDGLARDIGGSKGEALLKGLSLLKIAQEAKAEGKRLVVIDDRTDTEEEIVDY